MRGSSSRGAVRALLGMHTEVEEGHTVAFTIDGPKGPLYVAKPGPVLLARNTQVPIMLFYIAVKDGWVLKSWDKFVIPKPLRARTCAWGGSFRCRKKRLRTEPAASCRDAGWVDLFENMRKNISAHAKTRA